MREKKFTPGPWESVEPIDEEKAGIDGINGKAVVWWSDVHNEGIDNIHDAHLIAAAPELLEALERIEAMCRHDEKMPDTLLQCRTAIAKAYGEQP
jgi:hypothetical protein